MTEEPPLTPDQEAAVRRLVAQATTQVGRAPDYRLGRAVLRWVTGGRLGWHRAWSSTPRLGTPWEDSACVERADWRTRAAYVEDTDEPCSRSTTASAAGAGSGGWSCRSRCPPTSGVA